MTLLDLAQDLFRRGAFSEAADTLLQAPEPETPDLNTQLVLGVSLARCRRNQEAVAVFEKLLEDFPDTYEALTWLAVLTKNRNGGEEAVGYAERAIRLKPNDATGYSALGACHQYYRRMDPAISAFKKAVALAPDVAEHRHNLGLAYQIVYDYGKARVCFAKAIELEPMRVQSYVTLAEDYALYGSPAAFEVVRKGLGAMPESSQLHSLMGKLLTKLNQTEAAERHLLHAMRLSPGGAAPLAAWLVDQGRFDESYALYETILKENPKQGSGYYGLLQSRRFSEGDRLLFDRMAALRDDPYLGAFEQMHLRYALGKAEEQIGRYEDAMADYDVANDLAFEIHNAGLPPDSANSTKDHQKVERAFERLDREPKGGHLTSAPIFIIGMIRSGTTLLDQILSSHPSVKAAGELGFWLRTSVAFARRTDAPDLEVLRNPTEEYLRNVERLVGHSEKFTDKMPLNFAHAGIIHASMPNARFLHIRRNPVDTCLSIYTTYFGPRTPFAYDRSNIVAYYREYLRSMGYWREALPKDRLLEFDYEELVSRPEELIPRILEFCELPWDESCLYPERNETAILTPSRWQARQPINRASVERWRQYAPWLGEFGDLLPAG